MNLLLLKKNGDLPIVEQSANHLLVTSVSSNDCL